VETVVGHGSWEEAIDDVGWDDDDVLVSLEPSRPIAQCFLVKGAKILRNSPVPVV